MRTKEDWMEQAITDADDIRIKLMNGKLPIIETKWLLHLLTSINKKYRDKNE
jgi:hypothetical protein